MITEQSLNPSEYYQICDSPKAGAILQFVGVVRNHTSSPKKVIGLYYEAHLELAIQKITDIVSAAKTKFGLVEAHCIHRIGRLAVGEAAIVVTTAGEHREETFEANRYIVDRVKFEAPIWKQELFEDGTTEWGKNSGKKPSFIQE